MRYAIERDGYAVNVILADSPDIADLIAAQFGATARLLADGEEVAFPEPPSMTDLSATIKGYQIKIYLFDTGRLELANEIAAELGEAAQLAWNESPEFARDSALIAAIAVALNLSLDTIFAEAAKIKVP